MLSASCSRLAYWDLRWRRYSAWFEEKPVRNRFKMDLAAFSFPSAMPRRLAGRTIAGVACRLQNWDRRNVGRAVAEQLVRVLPACLRQERRVGDSFWVESPCRVPVG